MMRTSTDSRTSAFVFLVFAAAIYLGSYAVVQWNPLAIAKPTPEWPIAVDFFVLLPLIYFLVFRPSAKKALLVFIALVSLGVLLGSWIIPDDDKLIWNYLEQGRWIYLGLLITAQVFVLTAAASEIYRNRHAQNIEMAIEQTLSKKIAHGQVLKLIQADARVWTYGLLRDRGRFKVPRGAFFSAKHDMNASNQQAFLWLVGCEIPVAHILIHLFNPFVAVVMSTLSVYGFIFLLAEYRATILRASTLEDSVLHIRHGVLGDLVVPYHEIASVVPTSARPRRAKRSLRFVGTGTANIKLAMKPGTRLATIMGEREVESIYLGLDEPARFQVELRSRLGGVSATAARET